MKIFYFDVETTGLDPETSGIYEFAYIVEIDGKVVEEAVEFINPGDVQVSDFTIKLFENQGRDLGELLTYQSKETFYKKLLKVLDKYVNKYNKADKFTICGYNVEFDRRHLQALFLSFNNTYLPSYFRAPYLDVMVFATYVFKDNLHRFPKFSLGTLCELMEIEIDAHNALSDIQATRNLQLKLENHIEININ